MRLAFPPSSSSFLPHLLKCLLPHFGTLQSLSQKGDEDEEEKEKKRNKLRTCSEMTVIKRNRLDVLVDGLAGKSGDGHSQKKAKGSDS